MDDDTMQAIKDFLTDADFCRLRRLYNEYPLSWSEFCELAMPSGLSPDATWEMLHLVRAQDKIDSGFTDAQGLSSSKDFMPSWFKWNNELGDASWQISGLIARGSFLDQKMRKKKRSEFLLDQLTEGIGAVLQLEKSFLPEAEAKDILRGRVRPRCAYGAILSRLRTFLLDEAYVDFNLKRTDDIVAIYELLVKPSGDDLAYLGRPAISHVAESIHLSSESRFRMNVYMSPSSEIALSLVMRRAFGMGSALMGCLLGRLYFSSLDEVVLASLPLVESHLLPQVAKRLCGEYLLVPKQDHKLVFKGAVDTTGFDTIFIDMIRDMLISIQAEEKSQEVLNDCLLEIVRRDPKLNMRQIEVLADFMGEELRRVSLRDHQTNYTIAYATARSDLMGLAAMGYLTLEKCGKAFWFYPKEDLNQVVLDAWTQDSGDMV